MKIVRVTCCLFVLLLSLVAFAFTTSAPKAHAASGTTIMFKFHGLSAQADFDSLSPDGCIDTSIFVDGVQSTVNKQSSADVFIGQFDNCTNTQLLAAVVFRPDRVGQGSYCGYHPPVAERRPRSIAEPPPLELLEAASDLHIAVIHSISL